MVGTDTVSALAVGCPVVVKAHPGHPATCAKLAEVAGKAAEKAEIPAGAFSLLQGAANRVARELVEHPLTSAVAFTGSLAGGRTLAAFAAARPVPIPFHAEMGSLNPLYVLPGALRERGGRLPQAMPEPSSCSLVRCAPNREYSSPRTVRTSTPFLPSPLPSSARRLPSPC